MVGQLGSVSLSLMQPRVGDGSFDFWLGKWATSWKDVAGHSHKGSNVVLKLDGSVRELFEGPSSPRRYVGVSLSEWNPDASVWEQEYWDNTGYHAFFRGGWSPVVQHLAHRVPAH